MRGHEYSPTTGGACSVCGEGERSPYHRRTYGLARLVLLMTSLSWLVAGLAAMSLLDRLRPEPKCRHNNPRGMCTKCDGLTRERIPTGEFRGRSGGRLVPKGKGKR